MKFDEYLTEKETLKDSTIASSDRIYFGMKLEDFDNDDVEEDIKEYKNGTQSTKQDRDHSKFPALEKLVAETPLNRDYIVYRAFGGAVDKSKIKVGSTLKDRGYMSTSLRWSVARQFINPKAFNDKTNWIARITLKKGTKAFYLDVIENKHEEEKEILVNKGVQLKITGFTEINGTQIVDMTT